MRPIDNCLFVRKYEKPEMIRGIYTNPAWRQDNSRSLWEVMGSTPGADEIVGMPLEEDWIVITPANSGVWVDNVEVADDTLPPTRDGSLRTKQVEVFLLHGELVRTVVPWTKEFDMQVQGNRLLVIPDEPVEITPMGLVLPQVAEKRPTTAVVERIGPDVENEDIQVGERVLYSMYAGTEVELNSTKYLILDASQVLMVIPKDVQVQT